LTEKIGITGTEAIDNMPMINEFQLQTLSDNAHTTEITSDAPIRLGEKIYDEMTVHFQFNGCTDPSLPRAIRCEFTGLIKPWFKF